MQNCCILKDATRHDNGSVNKHVSGYKNPHMLVNHCNYWTITSSIISSRPFFAVSTKKFLFFQMLQTAANQTIYQMYVFFLEQLIKPLTWRKWRVVLTCLRASIPHVLHKYPEFSHSKIKMTCLDVIPSGSSNNNHHNSLHVLFHIEFLFCRKQRGERATIWRLYIQELKNSK